MNKPSTITLFLLISLASVSAVLFTPALPEMAIHFRVSHHDINWTISIFLVGYALGQLIYGPLTNRLGRKNCLYVAIGIALFGTLLCISSYYYHHFNLLLIGRFISALGSSGGLPVVFAMVGDVYTTNESKRVLAIVMIAFALMPGIGIFIGGFLTSSFPWVSCFYFLFAYYLWVLAYVARLPETATQTTSSLNPRLFISAYGNVIREPSLWLYALMWGFCTSFIYLFSAAAPIICIDSMQLTPHAFGAYNILTTACLISGNLTAGALAYRYSARTMIFFGALLITMGVSLLSWCYLTSNIGVIPLFGSVSVIFYGLPLIIPNASVLATQHIQDKATGSSWMTFLNLSTTVMAFMVIKQVTTDLLTTLLLFFVVLMLMIWTLYGMTHCHQEAEAHK